MFIKKKLEKYLSEHLEYERNYFKAKASRNESPIVEEDLCMESSSFVGAAQMSSSISEYININNTKETFQVKLFKLIDERGLKDSEVYNKVNIDRRLFSKIRSDINYHPSKDTIILLGIALELNEDEIVDLLESASYSLPMNSIFDLIIRFCFKEHIYNINTINEFLYDHNCKTLNT